MKFNKGDKAIVTGDTANLLHGYPENEVVTIISGPDHDGDYLTNSANDSPNFRMYVSGEDLEPLPV